MSERRPSLPAWFAGEFLGTFLLVFFGCGSVAAAVLTGAQVGIFQVAIVWGIAIATAIYLTGGLSGAHLNPAITLALAAWAGFSWRRVPRYLCAQCLGALAGALAVHLAFRGVLAEYESIHGITRGAAGSEATAMIFGDYFPNPAGAPFTDAARLRVTPATAFGVELLGTAILALVVLGCTDENNASRPRELAPVVIGLTVTILISLLGPLTMAGLNPARDLVPRLFSSVAGWGALAFTANGSGWLTVYIAAPLLGGLLGGGVYRRWLAPHYADRGRA